MERLRRDAISVMTKHWHDVGYTSPNAHVYPWLWLWDSCFHAIVWVELGEPVKAVQELTSALQWQSDDGFVPHMGYQLSPEAARAQWGRPGASTITQPPVHGHAASELVRRGVQVPAALIASLEQAFDFLFTRRRAANGLISVVHPWETGTDDSPRWDDWCDGPFDRFGRWRARKLELVERLVLSPGGGSVGSAEFVVQSAGFNALCAFSGAELARLTGNAELASLAAEVAEALDRRWDAQLETWTDASHPERRSSSVRTLDALLGVLVTRRDDARASVWRQLFDEDAFGGPFGPAGVHRQEEVFDPRAYWRGAAWPQLSYLLWVAARRQGRDAEAARLAEQTRRAARLSGHAEYWNPDTAEPLGAAPQSWTTLWTVMSASGGAQPQR